MTAQGTLVLTRQDIAGLLRFDDYLTAVEQAFRLYGAGQAVLPEVLHVAAPAGIFHIKAAGLGLAQPYVAVKINGNFPQNRQRWGLPTIQGAITLCDGATGAPLAFMDSIEITRQRTGAATALAARYLARRMRRWRRSAAVASRGGCSSAAPALRCKTWRRRRSCTSGRDRQAWATCVH